METINRWIDRFFAHRRKHALGYSIRRCGEDEIEIRASLLDGVVRGYIRTILLGLLALNAMFDNSHGIAPFSDEIKTIKRDFQWAFNPDSILKPKYEEREKRRIISIQKNNFPLEERTYEDFKNSYLKRFKLERVRAYFHFIWPVILLYLFFWPRARGLRVNRKERVIYAQALGIDHPLSFVPDKGDPLSGLYYNKFGLYVRIWSDHWSLELHMPNLDTGVTSQGWFGIYPTPCAEHNDDLINAMRAFLSEDNPEFLSRIGKRYRTPWTRPLLLLCNSFVYPRHFYRKRADIAIARAKALFAKLTPQEQGQWFAQTRELQRQTDQNLREDGFDNHIVWTDPTIRRLRGKDE